MEIFLTVILVGIASYFLYKSVKNKLSGKCDCSTCSSHCSHYRDDKEQVTVDS